MTKHCNARRPPSCAASIRHRRRAAHIHQTRSGHQATSRPGELPRKDAMPKHSHPAGPAHQATVIRVPTPTAAQGRGDNRGRGWLRGAMLALAVLAVAAAVVSWDAQYVLVRAVKHNPAVAGLEAGIPDIGAVIFAALGIALALHGKRALRARALNLACVGISLVMNALASAPGWPDLAIWIMPSAVYALASDTLIGVIRAWVTA